MRLWREASPFFPGPRSTSRTMIPTAACHEHPVGDKLVVRMLSGGLATVICLRTRACTRGFHMVERDDFEAERQVEESPVKHSNVAVVSVHCRSSFLGAWR